MNILVIEDNRQEMTLLREVLSTIPNVSICRVEHANRLAAACTWLARERFDAILLDLNLPDSAGLDTLARVHWERGENAKAIELQEKAVSLSKDTPMAKEMQETLETYKKGK